MKTRVAHVTLEVSFSGQHQPNKEDKRHAGLSILSPAALLMFAGLNSDGTFWALTEFAPRVLKQEQKVDFTTRQPLCSHPQSEAELIPVSVHTQKSLLFGCQVDSHEWMECERFGDFTDVHCTAFQEPAMEWGGR